MRAPGLSWHHRNFKSGAIAVNARRVVLVSCLLALARVTTGAAAAPEDTSADLSVSAVSTSDWTGFQFGITFDVTVTNRGPAPASEVLLEAVIDPATLNKMVRKHMQSPPGASCDTRALTCRLGELGVDQSVTVRTLAHVPADLVPTGLGVEFRASSKVADPLPCDNNFFSSEYVAAREGGGGPSGPVSLILPAWFLGRRSRRANLVPAAVPR